MPKLDPDKRAKLPNSAFAYVDLEAIGGCRFTTNRTCGTRSRFNQVRFEDDAARERARKRLLNAAKKHGIVPIGFITGQIESERTHAVAGRLVIELGKGGAPGELEQRLRRQGSDARRPPLVEGLARISIARGKPFPLPAEGTRAP